MRCVRGALLIVKRSKAEAEWEFGIATFVDSYGSEIR